MPIFVHFFFFSLTVHYKVYHAKFNEGYCDMGEKSLPFLPSSSHNSSRSSSSTYLHITRQFLHHFCYHTACLNRAKYFLSIFFFQFHPCQWEQNKVNQWAKRRASMHGHSQENSWKDNSFNGLTRHHWPLQVTKNQLHCCLPRVVWALMEPDTTLCFPTLSLIHLPRFLRPPVHFINSHLFIPKKPLYHLFFSFWKDKSLLHQLCYRVLQFLTISYKPW